jgi:hypothetical protein
VLDTCQAAGPLVRKAAKYGAAGLERYWVIDPDGPVVIEHGLVGGVLVEQARQRPGQRVTLGIGIGAVTFDPAELAD